MKKLIDKLYNNNSLTHQEIITLLDGLTEDTQNYLYKKARLLTDKVFGRKIYIRGLIEFTNYCFRNCMYCGIRKDNSNAIRYRLTSDEILKVCQKAYDLGFKTFVLQGGEDKYYYDERMIELVSKIRKLYPTTAITLSIGERNKKTYKRLLESGANRFLLRHETIHKSTYDNFHPKMSYDNRINCIKNLKSLGYQTGTGFLIGLPHQKITDYADDLLFIKNINPEMVGIGPFIPHKDTPLNNCTSGSVRITLIMLAIIRLLLPNVLLPSSTALNTLSKNGCYNGFNAGANVLMINLTPTHAREKYSLYEGKARTDNINDNIINNLKIQMQKNNYILDMGKGDYSIRY